VTRTRALLVAVIVCVLAGAVVYWRSSPAPLPAAATGGDLVVTVRAEPRSFNRLIARDRASLLVSLLAHARLVRMNLATQDVEPALAERWEVSGDGRAYTFHLRKAVTFSDGAPFTARDVAFTFAAVFDPKVGSPLASTLVVDGAPPAVTVVDDHTVRLTFAAPFAPAVRVLDWIPILPAHKLAAALEQGTFRDAWTVTTPPAELAGLGPFVLREYVPGERLVFERNPRYWKRDEQGGALPKLDRLTLLVVPDQNAEMLRLESGEADLVTGEARPEDLAALRRAAGEGTLRLVEAGVGIDPDMFWFNLRPDAAREPGAEWLTRPELRRAVALAVDRRAFVDVVYLGAGAPVDGPITPGNRRWYDAARPAPVHDPAEAGRLLDAIGLTDRNGDAARDTAAGTPARFALLTQKGNAVRERAAAFLQQELAKVGLGVDVVPLEVGALVERITKGTYNAAWFGTVSSDTDPGVHLDFWLSSGSFHVWHPGQASPATDWERRIDESMKAMVAASNEADRIRLFRDVEREFAAASPVVYFAAPQVVIPMSNRVGGARPAAMAPVVLWDAERLTSAAPAR
jgi:peptide/nickel transport system substrate-binding protein